jgi:hypothetical protein
MVRCLSSPLYSVLRPTKIAEYIFIEKVLYNPFSVRPLHDILRRANIGLRTPPLPNLITSHKTNTERYTRHFYTSQYLEIDRLAGYETANSIVGPLYFCNIHEGLLGFKSLAKCAARTLRIINS